MAAKGLNPDDRLAGDPSVIPHLRMTYHSNLAEHRQITSRLLTIPPHQGRDTAAKEVTPLTIIRSGQTGRRRRKP